MFGFFGKKSAPFQPTSEVVYVSNEARSRGLADRILRTQNRVTLLSPFAQHAARLQEALRQHGVTTALHEGSYRTAAQEDGAVPLLTMEQFLTLARPLAGDAPLEVIQVERHPLRKHDDAILSVLTVLPQGTQLHILHTLEDGIFQLVGGSMEDLLRKLGLQADETLEHPLIQKSIASAQKRIEGRVREEIPADSFVHWRERNLPPRSP